MMGQEEMDSGSVECRHCKTPMEVVRTKKYPGKGSIALIAGGLFCSLFFLGILVGVPMLMAGIYMLTAQVTISHCPGCGYYYKVLAARQ